MWTYNYNNCELYHHGVKGMKWGVRKQQKMAKKYQKYMIKYQKDSLKNARKLNLAAYNKTADEYNNGKIEEFNRTHDHKSKTYYDDYNKQFERDYRRNFDKMKLSEMENNANYKKAKKLLDKYDLTKVSDLARKNEEFVSALKRSMESDGTSWDLDMKKYSR